MNDPLNQLTAEEKLLLSLCRLDTRVELKAEISLLMKNVKDWDHFVCLANKHGITALCWYNITKTGNRINIPPGHLEKLHSYYLKNLVQNIFLCNQLDEIIELAKKNNIKIVLLKGIALEKSVYGNIGLRQLSDTDILVKIGDAILLRNILLENGYESIPLISPLHKKILPYLKSHLPVMHRKGVMTEIHVSLFDQPGNDLTEDFNDTAYNIIETEPDLFYPQPQLFFLYLVKHLDKHEKTSNFQVKFYTDLFILLKVYHDQIINKMLFDYARKANLENALSEKLRLLESVWGIILPDWLHSYLEKVDSEMISEKFIRFLRNPYTNLEDTEAESLFKPLKKIPGVFNKILFIIGYVFPSPAFLGYKFGTKSRVRVLLCYPTRWWQIVKLISDKKLQGMNSKNVF